MEKLLIFYFIVLLDFCPLAGYKQCTPKHRAAVGSKTKGGIELYQEVLSPYDAGLGKLPPKTRGDNMGKNDHIPVPDPVRKPDIYEGIRKGLKKDVVTREDLQKLVQHVDKQAEAITSLALRVTRGENERTEQTSVQASILNSVAELKSKLKEVIRSICRLAGGKSLGNLGLPQDEDWIK